MDFGLLLLDLADVGEGHALLLGVAEHVAVPAEEVGELLVDDADDLDLLVGGIAAEGDAGAGDHLLGSFQHCLSVGLGTKVHEIDDGLTDDVVQSDEDGQGKEAPQAAAHGIDALLSIELLQLFLLLSGIVGVLLLNLLNHNHILRFQLVCR